MIKQKKVHSIREEFSIEGVGLHNGEISKVTLKPSDLCQIRFIYQDQIIELVGSNVSIPSENTTSVSQNGVEIHTVEHLMSALFALEITSCDIVIEGGNEIPILDSSAKIWFEKINNAGLMALDISQKIFSVNEQIKFTSGISEYMIKPADNLTIHCSIDFPRVIIGKQELTYKHTPEFYRDKVALARSFLKDLVKGDEVNHEELSRRLKGYDINNSENPLLILYTENEYHTPLRIEREPVRHKLLDFIGDWFMEGKVIYGDIEISKPGHKTNIEFLKFLADKLIQIA